MKKVPVTHVSGSRCWPSSDPMDEPFDKLVCDKCGHSIVYQAYGTLPIGQSFDEFRRDAVEKMYWHLFEHFEDKK